MDKKLYDYDPMIYDVMRESAIRLGGKYISLARQSKTDAEREAFFAADRGVQQEADQVDRYNVNAVKTKTAEFADRLNAIMNPSAHHRRMAA
ncbi:MULTISPECIES: hypothetical protein [Bifidobacterium]|jgi:hypothetical protein|uniref:Uncharacterized protein n=1 Tax=Bifidobacterium tibiigranuli TaxID=2172043 RepID=A0A5N6S5J4_9BIFI|nr:hypothetical protein [Bifidobacterium tibiigranuli]KAE8128770.1 hypothetical protein DDE84_04765 [Bifidobacterium tibiigranuli]KAE8128961.1 hypothetical protein DDF78_04555 [Bifidobacterium tibiigranuli]MCH3973581.1 hypothetical protein [Bifidobacterium tibiigranuli]MCH4189761.1 hypothetical protein [Bifidobacterium tibiigranuli]MCH4204674.1 hypothetical protein [Bifidobacterium tibiigranuli]